MMVNSVKVVLRLRFKMSSVVVVKFGVLCRLLVVVFRVLVVVGRNVVRVG